VADTASPPAFQFYAADFISDDTVALMTNEQVGAYVLLLCYSWQRPDGLPAAMSSLARLCRCTESRFSKKIWPSMSGKWQKNELGHFFNPRLERVRQEQVDYRAHQSRAGRAGAASMWAKKRMAGHVRSMSGHVETAVTGQCPKDGSPSPSPSPTLKQERTETREPDGFARFWLAYPRKVGKDAAMKAFAKRKPDEATFDAMLDALAVQSLSVQWTREGGRFVPNPATWLNQGRWQDEVAAPQQQLSDLDLREAGEIYRRNWGGRCHHEEGHKGSTECIQQIAIDRRLKRSA
jgi:uncharacterized protein YdaU (DUF1376 family)